jgi:hypothetical protein
MQDIYLADDLYYRLVDFIIKSFMNGILEGQRDAVVLALGEHAGIWPEHTRDATLT